MDNANKIEQLKHIIDESKYFVCICGEDMHREMGYKDVEYSDVAYEIESKYGYATEEIFNSAFYATRKEQFFEFYRNEILSTDLTPSDGYKALCDLEKKGKLRAIITPSIFPLLKNAGCKNVIEMHGNITNNECPHCHKKYDVTFIKESKKVPLCTECGAVVRPGVYLFGETVDNVVMTRAMEEIERADVLLICGSNFGGVTTSNCIQYFNGSTIALINKTPHYADDRADLVIHSEARQILPQLV